jgi:peptidoglycan/LPS O-acetylase OafA/YrhL
MAQDPPIKKDVALEALRGLAAFVVVGWHLLLGYAPGRVPILPGSDPTFSILGQPWFGLIYGTSSVVFFFVLSGFVLSRKALLRSDASILARGAVKRWPRLAGPVVIAVLFSWALFVTHSYRYAEAGAITHSWWMSSFATAIAPGTVFVPNLRKAVNFGLSAVFLKGGSSYDSSLWTMHVEFVGSFIVFGLAAIMIALRDARMVVRFWLLIVILLTCAYAQPFTASFVVGVGLAMALANRTLEIPLYAGIALSVFAVWLMGYYPGPAGIYGWLATHLHHAPDETYVHITGSVIAIFVIETTPALRKLFSGRISVALGKLSFPVYLLHVPVLCSAGAVVFLATQGVLPGICPKIAAGATTLIVTVLLSWPLALFDTWWVRRIGAVTDRLVPRVPGSDGEIPHTIH